MSKRTASEAELEEHSDHLWGKAVKRYIPKLDQCVQEQTDLPSELAHLIVDFVTPKELIDWVSFADACSEQDEEIPLYGPIAYHNMGIFPVARCIFKQLPLSSIWFDDRSEMVLDCENLCASDLHRYARLELFQCDDWSTFPCGTTAMTLINFTRYLCGSRHINMLWYLEWMTADWLD
jgi:hypothetical protein